MTTIREFICPQCGQRAIETIQYDNAWEWSDDYASLGLEEDETVIVYHCIHCEEDLLIERRH